MSWSIIVKFCWPYLRTPESFCLRKPYRGLPLIFANTKNHLERFQKTKPTFGLGIKEWYVQEDIPIVISLFHRVPIFVGLSKRSPEKFSHFLLSAALVRASYSHQSVFITPSPSPALLCFKTPLTSSQHLHKFQVLTHALTLSSWNTRWSWQRTDDENKSGKWWE